MRSTTRFLFLALLVVLLASHCKPTATDGTTPTSQAELPLLKLTDATPDLLLTWFDERGQTHTGVSLAEVPQGSRQQVRVITADAGHGDQFYIADLSLKADDGSYAVQAMPRKHWESLLEKRRAQHLARMQPPAPNNPGMPKDNNPGVPENNNPGVPKNAVQAIVYGASWCRPCHQAAALLKRRGAHVQEYDIEKQPVRAREMRDKLKRAGRRGGTIPVIDVEGTMLVGFSPRLIERAIASAKAKTKKSTTL